jgi:hypothetical protein
MNVAVEMEISLIAHALGRNLLRRAKTEAVVEPAGPCSTPEEIMLLFVVDKVALGRVFSEYFGFPCQFAFHQLFSIC